VADDPHPADPAGPAEPAAKLPADAEAYDSPRSTLARARGLSAPYIAGGLDPDPAKTRLEERPYVRALVVMIVVIVLAGFVLGILANLLGG